MPADPKVRLCRRPTSRTFDRPSRCAPRRQTHRRLPVRYGDLPALDTAVAVQAGIAERKAEPDRLRRERGQRRALAPADRHTHAVLLNGHAAFGRVVRDGLALRVENLDANLAVIGFDVERE